MNLWRPLSLLLLVLLAGLAWGLNAPVSKVLYAAGGGTLFDGVTLAVARGFWSVPAFAVAAALSYPRGRRLALLDVGRLLLLGVLFGPGLTGFFAVAAQWTSAAHVVLISGLAPPATAALESLVRRRPPSASGALAIGLGVAGVVVLSLARSTAGSTLQGDALMLAWVADYAWFALLTRRLAGRYSSAFVSIASTGIGALIVAAGGLALGLAVAVSHVAATPAVALGFFGEMIVGLGFVGPIAYVAAIRRSNATVATTGALYAAVVFGLAATVVLAHEQLPISIFFAGTLLLASLFLTLVPVSAKASA